MLDKSWRLIVEEDIFIEKILRDGKVGIMAPKNTKFLALQPLGQDVLRVIGMCYGASEEAAEMWELSVHDGDGVTRVKSYSEWVGAFPVPDGDVPGRGLMVPLKHVFATIIKK